MWFDCGYGIVVIVDRWKTNNDQTVCSTESHTKHVIKRDTQNTNKWIYPWDLRKTYVIRLEIALPFFCAKFGAILSCNGCERQNLQIHEKPTKAFEGFSLGFVSLGGSEGSSENPGLSTRDPADFCWASG